MVLNLVIEFIPDKMIKTAKVGFNHLYYQNRKIEFFLNVFRIE